MRNRCLIDASRVMKLEQTFIPYKGRTWRVVSSPSQDLKHGLNYHRVGMLQRKFKYYCQPTNQTDILSLDFVFSN